MGSQVHNATKSAVGGGPIPKPMSRRAIPHSHQPRRAASRHKERVIYRTKPRHRGPHRGGNGRAWAVRRRARAAGASRRLEATISVVTRIHVKQGPSTRVRSRGTTRGESIKSDRDEPDEAAVAPRLQVHNATKSAVRGGPIPKPMSRRAIPHSHQPRRAASRHKERVIYRTKPRHRGPHRGGNGRAWAVRRRARAAGASRRPKATISVATRIHIKQGPSTRARSRGTTRGESIEEGDSQHIPQGGAAHRIDEPDGPIAAPRQETLHLQPRPTAPDSRSGGTSRGAAVRCVGTGARLPAEGGARRTASG